MSENYVVSFPEFSVALPVFGKEDLSKWAMFSKDGRVCYHAKATLDELKNISAVAAEWGERGVGEMCDVYLPLNPGKIAHDEVESLGLAGPVAVTYWRRRVKELNEANTPEGIWVRCVQFFDGAKTVYLPLPLPRKLAAFEDAVKAALKK